jgi:hypothetical protein
MDCYCERLEKGEEKRTWVSFCGKYRGERGEYLVWLHLSLLIFCSKKEVYCIHRLLKGKYKKRSRGIKKKRRLRRENTLRGAFYLYTNERLGLL